MKSSRLRFELGLDAEDPQVADVAHVHRRVGNRSGLPGRLGRLCGQIPRLARVKVPLAGRRIERRIAVARTAAAAGVELAQRVGGPISFVRSQATSTCPGSSAAIAGNTSVWGL